MDKGDFDRQLKDAVTPSGYFPVFDASNLRVLRKRMDDDESLVALTHVEFHDKRWLLAVTSRGVRLVRGTLAGEDGSQLIGASDIRSVRWERTQRFPLIGTMTLLTPQTEFVLREARIADRIADAIEERHIG